MRSRHHALLLAAGASVALCPVLLACDGDTSTDAGIDAGVDGTCYTQQLGCH
jgi:hypothetical protein